MWNISELDNIVITSMCFNDSKVYRNSALYLLQKYHLFADSLKLI